MDSNKIKIAESMMNEIMRDLDRDEKFEVLYLLRMNIIREMGGKP